MTLTLTLLRVLFVEVYFLCRVELVAAIDTTHRIVYDLRFL